MQLNNHLQSAYKHQHLLTWGTKQLGNLHESPWEAITLSRTMCPTLLKYLSSILTVNGVEYGQGLGITPDQAKEAATYQALVVSWGGFDGGVGGIGGPLSSGQSPQVRKNQSSGSSHTSQVQENGRYQF